MTLVEARLGIFVTATLLSILLLATNSRATDGPAGQILKLLRIYKFYLDRFTGLILIIIVIAWMHRVQAVLNRYSWAESFIIGALPLIVESILSLVILIDTRSTKLHQVLEENPCPPSPYDGPHG